MADVAMQRVGLRVTTAVVVAAIVTSCATSCGGVSSPQSYDYCAILPDAVGVYVGNPVTQMGYQIGTINSVEPQATSVRVDFSITEGRAIPSEVRAVVRSASILADRSLELVGNYAGGPELAAGTCVPLDRTATPKSISEVIGSANTFVSGIDPQSSSVIGDVINQLNQAIGNNGAGINDILSTSSRLLDSPDHSLTTMASIVHNLAILTSDTVDQRGTLKQVLLDAQTITPQLITILDGAGWLNRPLTPLIAFISDLETRAGDEIQLTLDSVSDAVRVLSPHSETLAWLTNYPLFPLPIKFPSMVNFIANHLFNDHQFNIAIRPPLFRIRQPNGAPICGFMNAAKPGSCFVVAGQPYSVDVDLLQYVFAEASK